MKVLWFKRDLRLTDHEPLAYLCQQDEPVLLLYILEPSLLEDAHYSERHWRFIWQSLEDMQQRLAPFGHRIQVVQMEALECLKLIQTHTPITGLCSYEETGIALTFARDRAVANWCKAQQINWREWQKDAVIRGLNNRHDWDKQWQKVMRAPLAQPALEQLTSTTPPLPEFNPPAQWQTPQKGIQTGGSTLAWQTLEQFFDSRGQNYQRHISSPSLSRTACSRLSPYLAWGNISLREFYQTLLSHWQRKGWRRALAALSSRLHWHCHFIQKFESEPQLEYRHANSGYNDYPYRADYAELLAAWQTGTTGIPLVDACMRCLHATGYINFRMRAMLVSVLCHHLNIDWRLGVQHMARLFLDFEPGIHYSQFQMQAGVTGINTIRIYNPVKQAQERDAQGVFIRRWLPELKDVPDELLPHPWLMTPMEEQLYGVVLGQDYPESVIDIEQAAREARERLWSWRKRPAVKRDISRILATHVRPGNNKRPARKAKVEDA